MAQAGDPGVLAPAVARERSWLMPLPGGAPPGASRDTRTLSRRARGPRWAGLSQPAAPVTRTWQVSKTEEITEGIEAVVLQFPLEMMH